MSVKYKFILNWNYENKIPEQIINKLRGVEILLNRRETIGVISKEVSVSAHTYYNWRRENNQVRLIQNQLRRKCAYYL